MSDNRQRRGNKSSRAQRGPHRLAFSNDPQFYGINGLSSSGSSRSLPTAAAAAPSDPHSSAGHTSSTRPSGAESACTDSKDSTASPDEGLTIAVSAPLRLNPDRRGPRQNMQPCASSGMNTPDHYTPPDTHHHSPLLNPVSRLAQEVGASLQLDQGARRPGHGRTPSAGTPSSSSAALRRTGSAVLVTNVDKHGGPRRRRSKNSMRSTSRSQSRPVSPSGSACSDISSAAGKSLTIVLKLGTSSICDPITHMPLLANLSLVVETICKLKDLGHRVVLVSSGAVGMGMRRLNMASRPKELAVVQATAAVGQGRLLALYDDLFGQLGQAVAQILLTRNDLSQYLNACNTFEAVLDLGAVPIVNENDTVSLGEIRFGDNDTLSAITAGMVHADFLFLLTDVDCLYTDNPRTNPAAKPVTNVTDINALRAAVDVSSAGSALGTGGMATKLIAAELATAAGVTTIITRGSTPQKVIEIIEHFSNPDVTDDTPVPASALCTRIVAKRRPMIDRKWWIMHGMYCAGTIYVDPGAVVALAKFKKSLFAAGIKRVEGAFSSNQAVRIVYEPEREVHHGGTDSLTAEEARVMSAVAPIKSEVIVIGHGLVNYTSAEISRIRGCHSSEFEAILGYCDSDNVINRGNMVITIKDDVLDDVFVTHSHKTKIRAEQRAPVPIQSPSLSAI